MSAPLTPQKRDLSGSCLCGDIRFVAKGARSTMSVCHCEMCRRWCGGPLFSVHVDAIEYEGDARPVIFASSKVAERGACGRCGSPVLWRLTAEGPYQGTTSVGLGLLDDQSGFVLEREWFIDKKPQSYAFEGQDDRPCVTEAEALGMLDG